MEGGRGDWSKRGLPVIRRVVRPGKTVGSLLRMVQEVMLFLDISREWRVCGNWKSRVVSVVFWFTVLMLFPRTERCSSFGSAARCRRADIEVISLCSRVNVVMVLGSGQVISESWFADAVRDVRPGNRDAMAAIYVRKSALLKIVCDGYATYFIPGKQGFF
jgi:hypothetical protein